MKKRTVNYINGRGAQINPANQYHNLIYDEKIIKAQGAKIRTEYIDIEAKSIINKVESPDIPFGFSMNPYQGCEHGCVYCYARNTHNFWGYSAGLDFEQKILVKKQAPKLLEKMLRSKRWKAVPIMFSGNTDCYQPAEREYKLTQKMLEILWKYRHPVSIITKNSLILRDIDILKKMAEKRLVKVAISITSLYEKLQQQLEPRTASVLRRLKTVELLSANGIPTSVMMAPIIPGLNDHEILEMAKVVAEKGARDMYHTIVRLNGDVATIFEDWLRKNFPDRADKVLNKIKSCHGGTLGDNRYGKRMSGEGKIAEIISAQIKLARKKYFADKKTIAYNLELYEKVKNPQLSLF